MPESASQMNRPMTKNQITLICGLLLLASSLFGPMAASQSIVVSQCLGQCPGYQSADAARNARVVIHHVYAAGLNSQTGLADWVAYRMTKEAVGVASLLSRSWQPDRLVDIPGELEIMESTAAQVSLASIRQRDNPYGGVSPQAPEPESRARLAPITSFANTPYWSDLNNVTNMVPMPSTLRLGAWLRLEQTLNTAVGQEGDLYVISGPLYLITAPLGAGTAASSLNPAAYFKVVLNDKGYAAFVLPESLPQQASYCEQRTELKQIEQMSGLILTAAESLDESAELLASLGCL